MNSLGVSSLLPSSRPLRQVHVVPLVRGMSAGLPFPRTHLIVRAEKNAAKGERRLNDKFENDVYLKMRSEAESPFRSIRLVRILTLLHMLVPYSAPVSLSVFKTDRSSSLNFSKEHPSIPSPLHPRRSYSASLPCPPGSASSSAFRSSSRRWAGRGARPSTRKRA